MSYVHRKVWIASLGAGVALLACSSPAGPEDDPSAPAAADDAASPPATDAGKTPSKDSGTAHDAGTAQDAAVAHDAGHDATTQDSGHASDAGGTDASTADAGGVDASAFDAGVAGAVNSATLQDVGRHGDDLRIRIDGTDSAGKTSAAHVRFLNASGAPVPAFDTNWDGVPDSAERRVFFDQSTLGSTSFTGTMTLAGMMLTAPSIAQAVVALENTLGARSAELTAPLTSQPVRQLGDLCDPLTIDDRCEEGLSCGGGPSKCLAGATPQITSFAYYSSAVGPTMLFRGSEPDQDMGSITVEFLDGSGNPISIDLNNDGTMRSSFALDARGSSARPIFFLENDAAADFATKVPKIAATPTDLFGHVGTRTIASLATAPVRSSGQSCDWRGFDVCASGSLCSPGLEGATNACTSATTIRASQCSSATKLDPAAGTTTAYGHIDGVSLFDAPIGCVPNDEVGRPESLVALHLSKAAATLTITTAVPETELDTAIYLLTGCPSSSSGALACNDDDKGFASTLSLKNVPAGDYTIVVESIAPAGGNFGLSVDAH
jgi:hypothetical protein